MVARTGDGWRKTLNNGSFAIHRMGAESERREVADVEDLLDLIEVEFGIRVASPQLLRPVLERLIQPGQGSSA
jgi:N-hydroxyarylamine O-acetyltransferase